MYRFEHDGSMERMWDVHSNTFIGVDVVDDILLWEAGRSHSVWSTFPPLGTWTLERRISSGRTVNLVMRRAHIVGQNGEPENSAIADDFVALLTSVCIRRSQGYGSGARTILTATESFLKLTCILPTRALEDPQFIDLQNSPLFFQGKQHPGHVAMGLG